MAQSETAQNIPNSNPAASGEYDKKCIFCKVVNKEMGTELLHSCIMCLFWWRVHNLIASKEMLLPGMFHSMALNVSISTEIAGGATCYRPVLWRGDPAHKSITSPWKQVADPIQKDEEISCFKDIKPAAPHHYLVVPTLHVGNCKSLTKEHVPLVKRMVELGKEILEKNNVTDLSDVRFGFHWPPFCSVTHLHLHVIAPVSQMGFMSRLMYKLNSYWFITSDQLIELLNSKAETN